MKYGIYINQKAVIDNDWYIIKANHCAVLEVIITYIASPKIKRYTDEYGEWYWISNQVILEAIPMFDIGDRRLRQIIADLVSVDLLMTNPENQKLGRTYLRLGHNYGKYMFTDQDEDAEFNGAQTLEKNFQGVGKIFPRPWKNISKDYNIKEKNINKDIKSAKFSGENLHVLAFLNSLPENYYEENYSMYGDCRLGVYNLIIDNMHKYELFNTWTYFLDKKIKHAIESKLQYKPNPELKQEVADLIDKFALSIFAK